MKHLNNFIIIVLLFSSLGYPQRIKDIATISGDNQEQVIGYGLVVGLAGTGDSYRTQFTMQSITSMLKRFGITVPQTDVKTRNVAAVMVTANLNSNYKPGAKFDVTVSSMGDATSLLGGTLLMTPLSGISGEVYAFAQGPLSIGGFDYRTSTGNRVAKNHSLAGRVPQGGILKNTLNAPLTTNKIVSIYLRMPDITTSNNVAQSINAVFGDSAAIPIDASEIRVNVPNNRQNNYIGFLAELEALTVQTDYIAKVVLNERTGTVVAGTNVQIKPVSITHGSLNITIENYPIVSQPGPFSSGTTAVVNNLVPYAVQDSTNTIAISGASNVQEVASALNSLKVSPKEIIAIFQALKEAGALIAELVII
ncbi:MAG: flagellar basal body P-ring protein FlgI [Ignavibacterium sp.]|jgi:flagellar P-ring protein precursor FlgI|nr:flagellar basal body P-ring protein FlgI [Ignavibacterium sp.]